MKKIAAFLLLFITLPVLAQQTQVDNMRLWAAPDHTRLVLDTSAQVEHTLFSLENPSRLVIDLKNAKLKGVLPDTGKDPVIGKLRSAARNKKDLRVVLDLKTKVKPKSFVLKPNRQYGHRLVVDLFPTADKGKKAAKKVVKSVNDNGPRDVVIAIDAGHGGEDPGAKGRRGSYEKNVVLAIARKLSRLVEKERGMKPVMIRKGDYYLGLRKRMKLARESRADLFISIHADAFRDSRVRGSSVYTLSRRGASSEAARWLAKRENSADLVGGVTLEDKDEVLASVLLDLSQTATQQASHQAAQAVFSQLKRQGKTHKNTVQKAGFMVLKSPDVPSMLVETAFISNPSEERKLNDPAHQQRLVNAIMKGIRSYFRQSPPPGTLLAQAAPKKHTIERGDTLSGIAEQYQISLSQLRSANGLSGDRIRIGQVLSIPGT
ncbi:N-acetylmuramoyl-L-alanine amidase [Solemya velesiana gill symbiont]|uniref:N-acetylmuramoyl-L-alanine amidase AmiC n=2 Tax=Solemya velesiana gill symbiont TaxID=1918948 RepID=A0A1T2KS96_9GAMM|nr:N-acetylmuramoyl-L-alanine amidase [Solemya velesiana gill symbiont]